MSTPTLEDIGRLAIADYHATEAYMADCLEDTGPDTFTLYDRMQAAAEALREAIVAYEKAHL